MEEEFLAFQSPLILDGAIGDELHRRGILTTLPLWSTQALLTAPQELLKLHQEYVQAGTQVLTANTFRTNVRTLKKVGLAGQGQTLTQQAVTLARQAFGTGATNGKVAGSIGPVEDCYRPDLVPSDLELFTEHTQLIEQLQLAQVDILLIETMNCIREARIALQCAKRTTLPVWVSFLVNEKMCLPSGEKLEEAYNAVLGFYPEMILANCFPLILLPKVVKHLHSYGVPYGVYPNGGEIHPEIGWQRLQGQESDYVKIMRMSLEEGVSLVGGCCGTTPAHIQALTQDIRSLS